MIDVSREFQLLGISGFSYSFQDDQKVLCPICSNTRKNKFEKCLSINVAKGTYHCFNCDWSGSVYTKQFKHQELSYKPSSDSVYKYFEARGITKEVVDRNKIGVIALHNKAHIVFPYTYNDKLINAKFKSRDKDFSQIKDADQILFKMDDVVDTKDIIFTEGEEDSLAFEVAGYKNAVSIPSGAIQANASTVGRKLDFIDNCYDILNSKQTFYLALDNDPHGIRTRNEIAKRLGEDKCLIVNFPDGCKDANETLVKFGASALISAIECATPYPIEGLKSLDESMSTIQYIYENGFTKGADTPKWKKFSDLITFHPGAVTVITGIPGFGKSTFLDNAIMQLSKYHEWKFAVMSSESNPTRHALALSKMYTGKAILPQYGGRATKEEFDEALEFLKKHIYHITPTSYDEYTVDKFLGYVELAYKRYGINAAILDPWGRMNNEFRNDSETHFISKAISKFQHFCKKLNIHLFIIVHPRKQEEKDLKKNEDSPVKQMYKRPTLYDINGSASWFNLCDNGIVVHQIIQEDVLYNRVYIDKVKFDDWGHTGYVDFEYRKACSRYVENHFELNESYSDSNVKLYKNEAPF